MLDVKILLGSLVGVQKGVPCGALIEPGQTPFDQFDVMPSG